MSRAAQIGWQLLAAVLLGGSSGCGQSQPPPLVPVRGKVYYQGRPLPLGTIVFTPDRQRGTDGPISVGEIQPDGSYVLRTQEGQGAIAGWHRVTIAAIDVPPPMPGQVVVLPRSLLPDKYRDPDRSGLCCEIRPGQENGINFHLQ
ncbi:MAG: hypothetical protein NZ700_12840 [Gemmataceae bacterium]|nr:hypothetical protein [Gemmataceae bacterium]MDW8266332.1 hypothetical protein [Gemmataceae bacterium]